MRNSRIAISPSNSKDCKQLQKISSKHVHVFHLHYSGQADNFGDQVVTLLGNRQKKQSVVAVRVSCFLTLSPTIN